MYNVALYTLYFFIGTAIQSVNGIYQFILDSLLKGQIPIAGTNAYSLEFKGYNFVELSNISSLIQNSFSIELWFYLNSTNVFQPLISHTQNANRSNSESDFLLQIQPGGTLNFFMGTTGNIEFGIFLSSRTKVQPKQWYHAAVSVISSSRNPFTPTNAILYLNGKREAHDSWNGGSRRLASSSVLIGMYDNSDPVAQHLTGFVDEVRIWNYGRHSPVISTQMRIELKGHEQGLVSYFKFDEGKGNSIYDSKRNMSIPQSQALRWTLAEVSIGRYYTFNSTKRDAFNYMALPAWVSPQTSLEYYVTQSPSRGVLQTLNGLGNYEGITTGNETRLLTNGVAYSWHHRFYKGDYVDSFMYFVKSSVAASVSSPAYVFVSSGNVQCEGIPGFTYDECGVCGGKNDDCECKNDFGEYRNIQLKELNRMMAPLIAENTRDLLLSIGYKLSKIKALINNADWGNVDFSPFNSILKKADSSCMAPWETAVKEFNQTLQSVLLGRK